MERRGFLHYHLQKSVLVKNCQNLWEVLTFVGVASGLAVVEGDLLSLLDLLFGKQAELGHVRVETVHVHVEDVQVGVAAVVYEVGKVAVERGVHCVQVFITQVEIQIKEIGATWEKITALNFN